MKRPICVGRGRDLGPARREPPRILLPLAAGARRSLFVASPSSTRPGPEFGVEPLAPERGELDEPGVIIRERGEESLEVMVSPPRGASSQRHCFVHKSRTLKVREERMAFLTV